MRVHFSKINLNGGGKIWHENPTKDDQGGNDRKGEAKEHIGRNGAGPIFFLVIGFYVPTAFVAGAAAFSAEPSPK